MTYERLIDMMHAYRAETLTRAEMELAIGLWQLKTYGRVA